MNFVNLFGLNLFFCCLYFWNNISCGADLKNLMNIVDFFLETYPKGSYDETNKRVFIMYSTMSLNNLNLIKQNALNNKQTSIGK